MLLNLKAGKKKEKKTQLKKKIMEPEELERVKNPNSYATPTLKKYWCRSEYEWQSRWLV